MGCFEQDVFVSYGWIDNERFGPTEEKWVEALTIRLEDRLYELLGRKAHIWRDERSMVGSQQIWPSIRRAISDSAIFLSVISPRCVNSDSCRLERSHYELVRFLRGGPTMNSQERCFHVIKIPVPKDELPLLYENQNGYPFFAPDMRGYPLELDPSDPAYCRSMNALAHDMSAILRLIDKRAKRERSNAE